MSIECTKVVLVRRRENGFPDLVNEPSRGFAPTERDAPSLPPSCTRHTTTMDSSPLSACSENSDSAARVYFGPMLSPEKKQLPFLPASSPTITYPFTFVSASATTRRSPRLSPSPLRPEYDEQAGMPGNDAGEQEEEEEEPSAATGSSMPWNGTPLQNILRRDGALLINLTSKLCL